MGEYSACSFRGAFSLLDRPNDWMPLQNGTREATFWVSEVDAAGFMAVRDDWHSLCHRAAVANVFMDPAVALAMAASDGNLARVLLVWARLMPEDETQLVGVWLGCVRRTRQSWPFKCFVSPTMSVAYLGTPVVDRAFAAAVLQRLLIAIRGHGQLPRLIELNDFSEKLLPDLSEALVQCEMDWDIVETKRRACLRPSGDPTAFWASTQSKAHASNLRRRRRQLSECGKLEFVTSCRPEDVAAGLREFLTLEESGWKGKRGTALASNQTTSTFTWSMIVELAERSRVKLHSLRLDDKAIAMSIALYSGGAAYTWRMAVDESFHRYSPGVLLLENVTMDLLRDETVAMVDSCNDGDTGFQAERWPERHDLVDILISTRSKGIRVPLLAARERSMRRLKRLMRDAVRSLLRRKRSLANASSQQGTG